MQEDNKVELDIDDVKEEDVTIDAKPAEEKPEKVDVDLGYTDPIKKDTKSEISKETEQKETTEEKTQDNLQQVSDNVQKRIDQLTRKMREAERREKAALDYAKGLQKKYDTAEKKVNSIDDSYFKEFEARVDAQREQVKSALKSAIDNNDTDKIMEANDKLTQLAVEKEKAKIHSAQKEEQKTKETEKKEEPVQQAQQPVSQPDPASPKAQEWAKENAWFGKDKVMTNAAFGIHQDLVEQGFDSESDEYYNEIDTKMRDYFPQKFVKEKQPVQTVASAGRKQEGRKTVKLTRSQVAIAKKLGVPLEEYAKHVKEQ